MIRREWPASASPDASLHNADWIKSGKDLSASFETTDQLRAWIKAKGMTVEQFKKLPVYTNNRRLPDIFRDL